MFLIFTDLDGTLLDRETYSWDAARAAVQRLKDEGIPWVLVTSKTRAETEFWRRNTGNQHPFVVENGAAVFVPQGYFPAPVPSTRPLETYDLLEWGTPYKTLVSALRLASERANCRVRGFHDMTAAEVAAACALSQELAELAKQREYDEPFTILDAERTDALVAAIESGGFRCTRGGRFWHITGANDKGIAVRALAALYSTVYGPVVTVGLGDGLNDVPMLHNVQIPIVVRSPQCEEVRRFVPQGKVTGEIGPAGWNEIVLRVISRSSTSV